MVIGTNGVELLALETNGDMEEQNRKLAHPMQENNDVRLSGKVKRLLWHGGSVYDAWFSAASNQVQTFSQRQS